MKLSKSISVITAILMLFLSSCAKENITCTENSLNNNSSTQVSAGKSVLNFPETFESGSKTTYTTSNITLGSGSWNFNDCLIGTTSSDRKNGSKSVRIEYSGMLTMNFDIVSGVSSVSFLYAKYSTEANSTFELWSSVDAGSTWQKQGSTITASTTTLTKATFNVLFNTNVRFQIRKTSGGRLNIDDFDVQDITPTATQDDNLGMGNPSSATNSVSTPDNYLMTKAQYVLSYNNSKGEPNWVSWHLSSAWKGLAARCDCFASDASLPSTFYKASTTSYTNSGFDRGHMCPSEDRDLSSTDNAATFLMTNMIPQSPNLNRITWVALEDYCRTLMSAGNELYIISGGTGSGGTGSNGGVTTSIASGKIIVPSSCWKIIVVLPIGFDDANRVSTSTRVIAVNMPNNQTVNSMPWGNYRVSVDAIESMTGYDFLSNIPAAIQNVIEAAVDNGPTS